jgi:hypothetical protein
MAVSQSDLLRKLIREEVALAIRTEMKLMMQELKPLMEGRATPSKPISSKNSLVESIKPVAKAQQRQQYVSTGDPIADLLNETRTAMQPDEYRSIGNYGAQDAQAFGMQAMQDFGGQRQTVVTENVSEILQAARPASDVSGVQLPDAVPDFTGLMASLKAKGAI